MASNYQLNPIDFCPSPSYTSITYIMLDYFSLMCCTEIAALCDGVGTVVSFCFRENSYISYICMLHFEKKKNISALSLLCAIYILNAKFELFLLITIIYFHHKQKWMTKSSEQCLFYRCSYCKIKQWMRSYISDDKPSPKQKILPCCKGAFASFIWRYQLSLLL